MIIYEFDLCDDNGQILESCIVNGSDCQDMEFLSLPFHNIDHVINYDLKIEKIDGNNDLSFGYYGTGNWDIYKGGELKGNTVSPLADLTMRAYSYNE